MVILQDETIIYLFPEETTSLLSSTDYNDNDIPPQVVELPPETSSSKGTELPELTSFYFTN
jgi:hypothetical protein